jgi:hypothetical protein
MVGDAAEQGARWHIGKLVDFGASAAAFRSQIVAKEKDRGVFQPAREIKQDAVGSEIGKRIGIEILDRGETAIIQQAGPEE